jgi:hypothetical protein
VNFYYARFLMLLAVIGCASATGQSTTLTFLDDTGKETPLVSGVNKLPSLRGTVRADGVPSNTQSVLFKVNGNRRVENAPPYYSEGDKLGKPNMSVWEPKAYTISAACYTRDGANGAVITSGGVSLKVTLQLGAPTPDPDPDPDPTPDPEPPPGPSRVLSGYGVMQQGNRQGVLSDALITHPKISFVVPRDRWKYLEPQDDVFNFSYMLSQMRRARAAGKSYVVPVMTGGSSTPIHVAGPRFARANEEPCLVPWAPSIPIEYRKLHLALANAEIVPGVKVKDDPYNVGVWITGCTVPSQEAHLNGMENAPGFSAAGMRTNWSACGRVIKDCYPNKPGIFSLSGQRPVQAYQPQVLSDLKGMFGRSVYFQHNSFKAVFEPNATHVAALRQLDSEGYRTGVEAVVTAADDPGRFGSANVMDGINKYPWCEYFVNYPNDVKNLR